MPFFAVPSSRHHVGGNATAALADRRAAQRRGGGSHLRQGRALDVLHCLQVPGQLLGRLRGDGLLFVLGQLLHRGGVIAQVDLSAHQQERGLGTVVSDLRNPLEAETGQRTS